MINWFEKHNKISWMIVIFIAIAIFYISSLTFEGGAPGPKIPFKSYAYHFSAFFFLGLFLLISITKGEIKNKNLIFLGIIIAILYAVLDEVHQLFVPGRAFSILDILTDSFGILIISIGYVVRMRFK